MFNWLALAVLLLTVGTSGYYRRRARIGSETIARSRESGVFMAVRAAVALLLFVPVIAFAVLPEWMAWASFALPVGFRWFGFFVGVLTIPAVAWVLRSLGRNVSETVLTKREHELVMKGPYRWVRHPLYTTGIVLFAAIGLMQASWFALFMAAFAVLLIRLVVIPTEERALVAKFGDGYRTYMGRTGRLLPRLAA